MKKSIVTLIMIILLLVAANLNYLNRLFSDAMLMIALKFWGFFTNKLAKQRKCDGTGLEFDFNYGS